MALVIGCDENLVWGVRLAVEGSIEEETIICLGEQNNKGEQKL